MNTATRLAFTAHGTQRILNCIFFLAFTGAVAWIKFGFHELWKDEWQAWMLVRDLDWRSMLGFLNYEGHPALWYVYLKLAHGITAGTGLPEAGVMQAAHLLTVAGVYFLLFFRLGFSLWLRVALGVGYFLFFEYGVVNRGYALTAFLSLLATDLIARNQPGSSNRQISGPVTALVFFLLFQTEVQGGIIGAAWCCFLLAQTSGNGWQTRWKTFFREPAVLGWLLGLVAFVWTVYPREAPGTVVRPYNAHVGSLLDSALSAFQGILANTFTIGWLPDTATTGWSGTGLLMSAVVLAALHHLFRQERAVWLTFFAGMLGFWLFFGLIYVGGVRQWGMVMVFFIGCLHLWSRSRADIAWPQLLILGVVLSAQMLYTWKAVDKEIRFPYSNASAAGAFIKNNLPPSIPVVAINPFDATSALGYAGRKFYALPEGEPFSFFHWLDKVYLPPESELKQFAQFKKSGNLVVIAGKPLDPKQYPKLMHWKAFDGYNIKNENFYLYTLQIGAAAK